jgi:hypothetical protein
MYRRYSSRQVGDLSFLWIRMGCRCLASADIVGESPSSTECVGITHESDRGKLRHKVSRMIPPLVLENLRVVSTKIIDAGQ